MLTPNHMLYVNGRWTPAGEVKVGDTLGFGTKVYSIEKVYYDFRPVYDLEVEPYHNYMVLTSSGTVLAHNATASAILIEGASADSGDSQLVDSSSTAGIEEEANTDDDVGDSDDSDIDEPQEETDTEEELDEDVQILPKGDSTTYVYNGTSVDPSAKISIMISRMYEMVPKPSGGSNDCRYRRIEYSGTTTSGIPFLRILMTSTKEVSYATIMPEKIEALRYIPYEKAKDALLGDAGINDVDFMIRITRLDGSEILSYGAQYKDSSTAIASYSRQIVIYPNEILEYDGFIPAILTVTVFK